MKNNNNSVNTQEKITPPKWLQNELHAKTEPQVDKIIAAYKKEKIGFSQFSLQTLALDMAALGYYHGIPNPPEEKETAAPSIQSKEEGKHTPGNLKIVDTGGVLEPFYINTEDDKYVIAAILWGTKRTRPETWEEVQANAARIVQCWNEYDGLRWDVQNLAVDNKDLKEENELLKTARSESMQHISNLNARITRLEEMNKALVAAANDLIKVAARETKNLIAWDGAISLDASIDRAKTVIEKYNQSKQ